MADEKELIQFLKLLETNWNPDRTYGPDRTPGSNFKRNPDGSFDFSSEQEESIEKNRLKRIGPWKKNVAAPSVGTPWPVELKESDVKEAIRKGRPDLGLGAEWLAWTSGSRPTKGNETSLKKMGLEGQPKPELAMTEERKENRLRGQVAYSFYRSKGKKVPSFDKFLHENLSGSQDIGHAPGLPYPSVAKGFPVANTWDHRNRLIDLYGEKEGRKFWKVDIEAERETWMKKQKEIWKYTKEYEKSAATKNKKKPKK